MGSIVVTEFVSLDGVVEGPGGEKEYAHAGWTFTFDRGADGDAFKFEEAKGAHGLLLGRRTYEGFAAAWPSVTGEFGDRFNSMPKYVVSSTLVDPTWHNTTVVPSLDDVAKLRDEVDGRLVVHGSVSLVHSLLEADMVDELCMMLFPIALGSGKRLFGESVDPRRYRLADSKTVGEGILILTYTR